jgi:hypothetical protein
MTKGKVTTRAPSGATGPLTLEQIHERIALVRRLVALSLDFDTKARTNAELAQAGLAELETKLASRGVKGGAQ